MLLMMSWLLRLWVTRIRQALRVDWTSNNVLLDIPYFYTADTISVHGLSLVSVVTHTKSITQITDCSDCRNDDLS